MLKLMFQIMQADIKNVSHLDTSSFVLKTNLANLESEVDEFDIDKLVTKVNNINTSGFA